MNVLKHNKIFLLFFFIEFFFINLPSIKSAEDMIIMTTEKNLQNGYDIYGENKNIIPFTVLLDELEIENLRPYEDPPFLKVIPAKTRMLLLKLAPKDRYKGVRISYKTKNFIGDYNNKHNDEINNVFLQQTLIIKCNRCELVFNTSSYLVLRSAYRKIATDFSTGSKSREKKPLT